MFSAREDDIELAVDARRRCPCGAELAMTFTGASLWISGLRRGARLGLARRRRAGFDAAPSRSCTRHRQAVRAERAFDECMMPCPHASPWWTPHVHADRRPLPARAQPHPGGLARLVRRARTSSRSRPRRLQVSPGNEAHLHAFATELIGAGGEARAALPAHLAGIRLQEAAGGGREAHLRLRPGLPEPRARRRCTTPNSRMLEWYRAE